VPPIPGACGRPDRAGDLDAADTCGQRPSVTAGGRLPPGRKTDEREPPIAGSTASLGAAQEDLG